MRKYLFNRDTLLATLMVFVVMGLLWLIPFNTHVLDPIKLALHDFDYNDLAYSKLGKNSKTSIDTNIVIVNIGDAGRKEIAEMLQRIRMEHPKVIGLDVTFDEPKNDNDDALLASVLSTDSTTVMAYRLKEEDEEMVPEGFYMHLPTAKGYANFVGEDGGIIRQFAPFVKSKEQYESLSAAIVRIANPERYQKLKERNHKLEIINYTHTPDKFVVVDADDLFTDQAKQIFLRDKIVLLGFITPDENNIEDKHFTPMNEKAIGKTNPDMEGVFIHANIIEMMLSGNYVKQTPTWLVWIIALILCWLHTALFIHYFLKRHLWFHLVAKTAQLISAVFFIYLGLVFFAKFNVKINLTPSIVAIILAVDVIYFYEALIIWLLHKYRVNSLFAEHHKQHIHH